MKNKLKLITIGIIIINLIPIANDVFSQNVGINNDGSIPDANTMLDIKSTGSTSSAFGLKIKNSQGDNHFVVRSDGNVGVGALNPLTPIHVLDDADGWIRVESTNINSNAGYELANDARSWHIRIDDNAPSDGFVIRDITSLQDRFVIDTDGKVGIGTVTPSVSLDVNGSVNCTGGSCGSDVRWKRDIEPLEDVLKKVQQLRGVNYHWKKQEFAHKNFTDEKQLGLIAQEVEKVYPELISTDNEGYKSMDYMSFSAVLLEAIKEQQLIIENQKGEIKKQNQEIRTLKVESSKQKATIEVQKGKIKAIDGRLELIEAHLSTVNK